MGNDADLVERRRDGDRDQEDHHPCPHGDPLTAVQRVGVMQPARGGEQIGPPRDADRVLVGHDSLGRERVEDARAVLKVGDEVEAKFTGVDRKSRTISLSIKAKEAHEEAEAVQSYRSETAPSGTSLGDLLKEHIGSGER